MLTIRADAWHLRLWRWAHESKTAKPKNLCRYFWFLFFLITVPTIAAIALLIGASLLIWVMVHHWEKSAMVIAGIVAFALFILGVAYFGKRADEKRKLEIAQLKAEGKWPPPPKEPNVFFEWMKAKKQKVCPLIAVKEVDD